MATTFRSRPIRRLALYLGLGLAVAPGCQHTPIDLSEGPAPLRMPKPGQEPESYEDSLTGGEVFARYCNQCHNARALAERPFASYQNVAAHMRVRSNLTGEEYEKVLEFLRRWHDIPSPTPPDDPSPKRVVFPQPIAELRGESMPAAARPAAAAPAQPGAQPAAAVAEPLPAAQPLQAAPGP
jgi:hypothetical protein